MAESIQQRSFSFTFRNMDGGTTAISHTQEFDQEPPEGFRKQMEEMARRLNEAAKAKGYDLQSTVRFQSRVFEWSWVGRERDLAIIYAIGELLGQVQDKMRAFRTIVETLNPREAGVVKIKPGRKT